MPRLSELEYELPRNLARFAGPQVERKAKLAAARGVLPLPPKDLVQVLFALARDPDEEIKKAAAASLLKMPENILRTVCEDPKTHPLLLDFLARGLPPESPLHEAIALNRATHDETVIFQAGLPVKKLVDIISNNQIRILRCPAIVDALAENPLMGMAQLDRIIKFVEMETKRAKEKQAAGEGMEVEIEEVEEEKPAVPEPGEEEEVPAVTEEEEEEVSAVTLEDEEESPWLRMTFDPDLLQDHKVEDEKEEQELETNIYRKIQKMKVSEKIKLALTGGAQARSLLIKDSNKMVATAVLKSPRLTDNEIESFTRSRSLADDVIRIIAQNREWTKSYQVKLNLVQNPKCPLPEAMRFMNFLRDKDLRDIARSKNVPSQIATQARRLLQRKEMKAKPGAAKH